MAVEPQAPASRSMTSAAARRPAPPPPTSVALSNAQHAGAGERVDVLAREGGFAIDARGGRGDDGVDGVLDARLKIGELGRAGWLSRLARASCDLDLKLAG